MNIRVCFVALLGVASAAAQPVIVSEPQDRVARAGAAVAFSVSAQGAGPLRYQWQFNGQDIPHAVGKSLSFVATPSRTGQYRVVVRDASGAVSGSSPARLQVQKRPVILQQPRNARVGIGGTALMGVTLNDSGPYTSIQWWHHSAEEPRHPIPPNAAEGVNTFQLEVYNTSDNGTYNGLYWIVVANNVGTAVSRRASLHVIGPPRLVGGPQDRSVRRGGAALFLVSIARDAAGPKTKQWFKDGEPIPGKTGRVLVLFNVQPEDAGFYHCQVTSMGGTASSYAAVLTVR
jgi:hypothetical protein